MNREALLFGNLNNGVGNGGLSNVNGNNDLSNANWNIASRISEIHLFTHGTILSAEKIEQRSTGLVDHENPARSERFITGETE